MWHVGVDVGGTFTDLVAVNRAGGQPVHLKVSTVSGDPAAGFMEAIKALRLRAGVGPGEIESIFHGTTLVTNAIIERNLAKTALVTTKGFRDILEIGRHWRSDLYDPEFEPPPTLVRRALRFEVDERIDADGTRWRNPARSPESSPVCNSVKNSVTGISSDSTSAGPAPTSP
jgi:N-methylhydantoinase A